MKSLENVTITIHYPTPENQEEYDRRLARVYVGILTKELSEGSIDRLIKLLKEEN